MSKILPPGVTSLPTGVFYSFIPASTRKPHQFRVKDPHGLKTPSKGFARVKDGLLWANGRLEGMRGRTMPTGKVAWGIAAKGYLAVVTGQGKRKNYIDCATRVCQNITEKGAGDITAPAFRELVREYLDKLVAAPGSRQPGAVLSPSTRLKHLAVIRAVCHWAVAEYRIPFDPVDGVMPPKITKRTMQTLTLAEAAACVSPAMESDPYFLRFATLLYLGLRERSEGLWLKWEDYHADRNVMQIRERDGENELKTGEREVPVPAELAAILKRTRRQGPFILARKIRLDDDGEPIEDRTDYARFKSYLRKSLLPADPTNKQATEVCERVAKITRHSLRHLYARVMASTGIPLSSLKTRMGHTSITTTMIYAEGSDSYDNLVTDWPKGQWRLRTEVDAVVADAARPA